ncbi:MAG TPA: MATE family efflux transporter, partial [Terriglobales bacterium]|nr:MATE family efflux transporter [Terriglobales bacterium]
VEMGTRFIRIMCYFYFIFAFMSISSGLLRGAGDVFYPMTTTVVSLIIRIVAAVFLIKTPLGALGLIVAMPVGWLLAGFANSLRLARGKWKEKGVSMPTAVLIEE